MSSTTVDPYNSNNYSTTNRVIGTNYGSAVFTDKKNNSNLDSNDFLNLMVAELKNQDCMSPMDNTQYITQMSQFSSMQAMEEFAEYSKNNYAMSLVGKEVTATRNTVSGDADTTTGVVKKVALSNNDYVLYIGDNGKSYTLDQITSVQTPQSIGTCLVNTSGLTPLYKNVTSTNATVYWPKSTEDDSVQKGLTYKVYYSTSGPLDTVDKVKAATWVPGSITNTTDESKLTMNLTGLNPNTTYYFNVLATDANGNQDIYKSQSFKTKASGSSS